MYYQLLSESAEFCRDITKISWLTFFLDTVYIRPRVTDMTVVSILFRRYRDTTIVSTCTMKKDTTIIHSQCWESSRPCPWPRGQYGTSLALVLRLKSLALASVIRPLALALILKALAFDA